MKTNLTNSEFQSKYLPIIQKAETEIKKLVLYYALRLKSKIALQNKIKGIIKGVEKTLPFSIIDREKYIEGLYKTSQKLIKEIYDNIILAYFGAFSVFVANGLSKKVNTPIKLYKALETGHFEDNKKVPYDMLIEAKASPNVTNYPKVLKDRVQELSKTQTTSSETSKKPISLWQKAEIDIRHENQMNKIEELVNSGVQYAWTSSHPDCSKRCERWQAKLFDLTSEHSELSNFRMRKKVDGHTVYCFKEVIAQKDKYGYTNNIIVGFNCRHKLIPYTPKSVAPKEYDKEDIKKEREINAKLRYYERTIRFYKQKAILYNSIDQTKAKHYKLLASKLTEEYKKFANENGFAWYQYRIEV